MIYQDLLPFSKIVEIYLEVLLFTEEARRQILIFKNNL
jgi:hypothetical protein